MSSDFNLFDTFMTTLYLCVRVSWRASIDALKVFETDFEATTWAREATEYDDKCFVEVYDDEGTHMYTYWDGELTFDYTRGGEI